MTNSTMLQLSTVIQRTSFETRAWQESLEGHNLIQLTTKILFDSKTNFKTISLCTLLSGSSLICDISARPGGNEVSMTSELVNPPPSIWLEWLSDFFTVVEYPVTGYVPPAILTELRFDLRHCTVDITCDANTTAPLLGNGGIQISTHHMTVALGGVKILCSLLDTGMDASIAVNCEDLAFYLRDSPPSAKENSKFRNRINSTASQTWVCVCDLDFFNLAVCLRDKAIRNATDLRTTELDMTKTNYNLDVCISCNLLRLRTCTDTIVLIVDICNSLCTALSKTDASAGISSASTSRGASVEPDCGENIMMMAQLGNEDVIPDLADAMAELDSKEPAEKGQEHIISHDQPHGKSKKNKKREKKKGAHVFFFPDEGGCGNNKKTSKKSSNSRAREEEDFARDLIPKNVGMTDSFYNPSTSSMRLCSRSPLDRPPQAAIGV